MLKAYKYRIYPNSEQRIQIAKTFGCCRFVYNQTLAYRKEIYEKEKKSVSKTDCNNYCNRELKKDYEWLKEIDKFALTNAIYNMDASYQKFFKEHAGYPKFKSKHDNHKSYTTNFTNGNIAVDFETGKIKLPKLKAVKAIQVLSAFSFSLHLSCFLLSMKHSWDLYHHRSNQNRNRYCQNNSYTFHQKSAQFTCNVQFYNSN